MPETFFVTVRTEGGELLMDEKITGDYVGLSYRLLRLCRQLLHQSGAIGKLEITPGGGISQYVPPSSQPTEPSHAET
jgi:hypothetical protein